MTPPGTAHSKNFRLCPRPDEAVILQGDHTKLRKATAW